MPIPTPAREAALPDFGPLLAALNHAEIDFIVIGPAAARGRGAGIEDLGLPHAIDLTPAPTDGNLAGLAAVLEPAGPRLRADDMPGLPIALSPDVVRSIPAIPLTTQFGDLNIVLRPVGAPSYDDMLDDASTVELDTVPTLVPTIEALLRGLAGGARQPHPDILSRLRQLVPAITPSVVQPHLAEAEQHLDLERAIIEALERLGRPSSIRDLLFAMKAARRPPYKQVKIAAEALTDRGRLLRDKEGTAHRYRLDTAADERLAYDVAALLAKAINAEATADRALNLLASDAHRPGEDCNDSALPPIS